MWDITYEVYLASYPGVTITSVVNQKFQIEVHDPCKAPLLSFNPVAQTDRSYTLIQTAIGPFMISPFTLSSSWCAHSYSYTCSYPSIAAAITFDAAAVPPTFKYYLDADLETSTSQFMIASAIASEIFTITLTGVSDTVTSNVDFKLTVLNPCSDSTFTIAQSIFSQYPLDLQVGFP